jgi:hypothetical protein
MSSKTVCSDSDIPESKQPVLRSNKRRNAVFMGTAEHVLLMKVMQEEDSEIFALSPTHSLDSSNPSSLTELDLFEQQHP